MDLQDKRILDVCCGGRMFWFDKEHPNTLYLDIRDDEYDLNSGNRVHKVHPDIIMDFRELGLPDDHFDLVIFDPPHMTRLGASSWMAKKYGVLDKGTWQEDIRKGFEECLRVTKLYGTLIFKWSEAEIPVKAVIEALGKQPLFGHTTRVRKGANGSIWMAFLKGVD